MPSLPESASVILLSSVGKRSLGQRVRLVARVVGIEEGSTLVWVEDSSAYMLVDVTTPLAADNAVVQLFRQPRCHIMVTGYVEELEPEEKFPARADTTTSNTPAPLVIRAVLVQSVPDIDMNTWRSSVSAREKLVEKTYLLAVPKASSNNSVD